MYKIGLTGGIGTGKTWIGKIFESLGIPRYDSDLAAKSIVEEEKVKEEIIKNIGNFCYDKKGCYNKKKISELIFKDIDFKEKLTNIIYKNLKINFENFCNKYKNNKFIIKESALLFETGNAFKMDTLVLVLAPKTLRIERIQKRNGFSLEQINTIMTQQWSDEQKKEKADFCIYNDEKIPLLSQIITIFEEINTQVG